MSQSQAALTPSAPCDGAMVGWFCVLGSFPITFPITFPIRTKDDDNGDDGGDDTTR